ncbi:uncharacterized protein C22orf15 homolog isoform X1 [Parus major]|uniref:uncharacterized protein C22orf15 homolog isoform X1 n=1 Tax=Parus major TaxID=9157 RepID=UPI000771600B|nr:uncharacterized protein C22orf15 homolog isoform X1 [Parus major]
MFATVRFGANCQEMVNLLCCVQTLTGHLKWKCQCRPEDCIDLVDEKGTLMNLSKVEDPASEYASKYLQGRQRYILIRVVREGNSEVTCYESLLEDLGKHYPDLPGKSQAPTSPPQKGQGCRHDSCSHLSPQTAQWDSPLMPLCPFRALMAPREGTSRAGVQDPLLVKSDTPHQAEPTQLVPLAKGLISLEQGGKDIRRNWETLRCLSEVGSALLSM